MGTLRQLPVSVCIPTYNRSTYLSESLASIRQQTFRDFEVIVFDDASTDDTEAVVKSVSDIQMRYFRHSTNVGVAANRNSCLDVAKGEYVAWLDSDDLYHPEMLARQKAVLDNHPGVGLVHGAHWVIDRAGQRLPDWPMPFLNDRVETGHQTLHELVLSNYISAPTVMVRRSCYDTAGRYSTDVSGSEDWEMWLRIALTDDFGYTANAVASYRYHFNSLSAESMQNSERLRKDRQIVDRFFNQHGPMIDRDGSLKSAADAALGARALIHIGEMLALNHRHAALAVLMSFMSYFETLQAAGPAASLRAALLTNDEYGCYRHSKTLLRQLHRQLRDTRYGHSLERIAIPDAAWEGTLAQIANTVKRIVPQDQAVAVIDKHDPTVLHLSGRQGWHFPDRELLPEGYPSDGAVAIQHLEELRKRGARYLVIPNAAFWWLEYYLEFKNHLERTFRCEWSDDQCVIYRLFRPSPVAGGQHA